MLRSIHKILKHLQIFLPQSVTADIATSSFDVAGYRAMMFLVNVGTFAFTSSNKIALEVQHCDDNSTWVAVGADDLFDAESTGVQKILDNTGDDAQVYPFSYRGQKRYVRLNLNVSGTVAAILGVVAVGGDPELMPPL